MSHNRIVFSAQESLDVAPITIYPIQAKSIKKHQELDDNFLEFQRIYGHVIRKHFGKKPVFQYEPKVVQPRPRVEVKTIQLEMPLMGTEKGVIKPKIPKKEAPKKPPAKAPAKHPKQKVIIPSKTGNSTHELMRKLSQMEHCLSKDSKISIHQGTSTFIDITNRELDIANEQLRHIKQMIEKKQAETQTIKKTEKIKKSIHHLDCGKKCLSGLSSMRRTLKKLEEKLSKRPQVVYKSVNERFTQSSLETLFKNQTFSPDAKFDETLNEAISGLSKSDQKEDYNRSLSSSTQMILDNSSKYKKGSQMIIDFKENGLNGSVKFPFSPMESLGKRKLHSKDKLPFDSNDTLQLPSNFRDGSLPTVSSKLIDDFLIGQSREHVPRVCSLVTGKPCGDYKEISQTSKLSISQKASKNVRFDFDMEKKQFAGDCEPIKYHWLQPTKNFAGEIESIGGMSKMDSSANTNSETNKSQSFKTGSAASQLVGGDKLSKCIDLSERKLQKYLHLKQDVADINAFCEKLCNISESDEEDDDDVKYKKELEQLNVRMEEETRNLEQQTQPQGKEGEDNIFDDTKLQSSVLKSSFLMKEFNIKPKIFTEKSNRFPDKNKFYHSLNKCKESGDGGVKNLINNLESALENSIYSVGEPSKM